MSDTKTPKMAVGDDYRLTITLSADQWEAIAAEGQYRLFAICDLAVQLVEDGEADKVITGAAEAIRDLCRLPHADLRKAGLLK